MKNRSRNPSLFLLALPTIITFLAFAARQLCDSWMVGQLGTNALAALLSAQQFLFLLFGVGVGTFTGLNICCAHAQERHGPKACGQYLLHGCFFAWGLGLIMAALSLAAPPLFQLVGHELPVRELEVIYFRISAISLFPQFFALCFSNFFFALNQPSIPMRAGLIHVVVNIIANAILMFGIPGHFEGMGIAGAAWGTFVASIVWALFLIIPYYLRSDFKPFHSRFLPDRKKFRDLRRYFVANSSFEISDTIFWTLALSVFVAQFGTEHIAASAIVFTLILFIIVPGDGVGVAISSLTGQFLGNENENQAIGILKRGTRLNLLLMLPPSILCVIFQDPIIAQFTEDPTVTAIAQNLFIFIPILIALDAIVYAVDNWLAATGDVVWTLKASIVSNLILMLGGPIFIGRYYAELGSTGIWLCIALNRATIALLFCGRFFSKAWRAFSAIHS